MNQSSGKGLPDIGKVGVGSTLAVPSMNNLYNVEQ